MSKNTFIATVDIGTEAETNQIKRIVTSWCFMFPSFYIRLSFLKCNFPYHCLTITTAIINKPFLMFLWEHLALLKMVFSGVVLGGKKLFAFIRLVETKKPITDSSLCKHDSTASSGLKKKSQINLFCECLSAFCLWCFIAFHWREFLLHAFSLAALCLLDWLCLTKGNLLWSIGKPVAP